MKSLAVWIVLIIIAATGAGVYFWKLRTDREARLEQMPAQKAEVAEASPPQSTEPETAHPLPEAQPQQPSAPAPKPLPPLNESDETVRESLATPLGKRGLDDIVISKDIARHIVATIDNLPRKKVAERLLPVKPPSGQLVTSGQGEIVTLSAANYARYVRYVRLAQAVDAKQLVALYVHLYPLFQQAYQELGYPKKYFNDRLVQVIDHLLATPAVKEPVALVRPKVLYEFEEPELEDLSAGQKMMIRIGPENAAAMKAKLREIRQELATEIPVRR
jgi:hypothetical protein